MPAKAVYLIAPGYRRWLTPDATELVFETEGFDAKDAKNWQARLIVSDLDGGAEANSTFPIDLSRKTFSLPVPKFHRRAEIILFIENPRDREPVCEGRWKLTNIPKEELAGLSYFDSRGVFFHEGVGRFPIVAWPSPTVPTDKMELFANAGYSGLVLPASAIDEKSAELATKLKLVVFVYINEVDQKKAIRRIERHSCIAGYFASIADKDSTPKVLEYAAAQRAADSSRPNLVMLSPANEDDLAPNATSYEDALLVNIHPQNPMRRLKCVRSGRPHFDWAPVELWSHFGGLEPAIHIAAGRGASGVIFMSDAEKLESWGKLMERKVADAIANAVVRGVAEPSDDSTDEQWIWRRRLPNGERATIEVKPGVIPGATFKIERIEK